MIGILKGDVIGSPYRVLDTDSENFTLLDTYSALDGRRLVTSEASLTAGGLLALSVGRWLGRGVHTDTDLWNILEEAFASVSEVPGRTTFDDPSRSRAYLAGAAVCGEWCDDMEEAQEMSSRMLAVLYHAVSDDDIPLGDMAAARAMASISWMAHHGASPSEMAAYMMEQTSVDITSMTQRSFRDALVGVAYERMPRSEVERIVDEVSDSRMYVEIRKDLGGRQDSIGVRVPYVRRDTSGLNYVRAAMYAALSVDGWEAGVRRAVSLGGDSSLVASLAGGIGEGLRPDGPALSVDVDAYLTPFVRETLSYYDRLMSEKALGRSVKDLRDRFSGKETERDLTPLSVTYLPEAPQEEDDRNREREAGPLRGLRGDGVDFLFTAGRAEACVLGRPDEENAVRAAFPAVSILTRKEFDALAVRRQREHDRSEMGDMAMLSGAVCEVRRLYVEGDGTLKDVTQTSSPDVTSSPKARAKARAAMDSLKEAARVVMSQFIENGTGRDILLPTAYRLEYGYSDSVRGYRGNQFRDDILIDQKTGLLRRVESSDICVGEYQESDKMIMRMFDGCEFRGRSGVDVHAAVENMKELVLDEGDRVESLDDRRDEETGYRIDEGEYYGAPQTVHRTNIDRLDADFGGFSSDEDLDRAVDDGVIRVVPVEERSLSELIRVLLPKTAGKAPSVPEPEAQPVPVPSEGFSVTYTESRGGYRKRTFENADPSKVDFTVAFAADFRTSGEKCTRDACEWTDESGVKQSSLIPVDLGEGFEGLDLSAEAVRAAADCIDSFLPEDFLREKDPLDMVINIAGNGLYTLSDHGITQRDLDTFVTAVFVEESRRGRVFSAFRSGGQTGADETVTCVAHALGCPATVHAPKGWIWRDSSGNTMKGEDAFKARFAAKDLDRTYGEAVSILDGRALNRRGPRR